MPRTIEGSLVATGLKLGVVVGRFNSFIAERMLEGAIDTITRHGGDPDAIDIVRVPGAFEIPFAAKKLLDSDRYDAGSSSAARRPTSTTSPARRRRVSHLPPCSQAVPFPSVS